MPKKFIGVAVLHIGGLVLVLLPEGIKGSVLARVMGMPVRVLDAVAVAVLFLGSVLFYYALYQVIMSPAKKGVKPAPEIKGADVPGGKDSGLPG